jgi:hypothetical protein
LLLLLLLLLLLKILDWTPFVGSGNEASSIAGEHTSRKEAKEVIAPNGIRSSDPSVLVA